MTDHWSDRFKRNFYNGDLLLPAEVAEVISVNSDKIISRRYVSDLATLYDLERIKPYPTVVLYKYEQIKDIKVANRRGRRARANPSPNALRQREFKARRRDRGPAAQENNKVPLQV